MGSAGKYLSIGLRLLAFAAFAFVGYNVQLDRSLQKNASLIAMPGGVDGGFGDILRTRAALLTEPAEALPLAERLVRHRPVPAANLELLAIAAAEADQMDKAGEALQLAARRGWRGEYTQSAAVAGAVSVGDYEGAIQRLEGLIRSGSSVEVSGNVAAAIAQVPEARPYLADRMIESEPFRTQLAKATATVPGFAPVMESLVKLDGDREHDCEFLARVTPALLARGIPVERGTGWPKRCADALDDGGEHAALADPYGWSLGKGRGLSQNASVWRQGINIRNRSLVRHDAAYRYSALPAGSIAYEFTYEVGSRPGQGEASLAMSCVRDGRNTPVDATRSGDLVEFAIPENCPVQRLAIVVERGDFSDIRVERAGS